MDDESIRLQKFLASKGIASRRKCEEYIAQGLVEVNGKQVLELGKKINPNVDVVNFRGKAIEKSKNKFVYILLNKPIRLCNNSKRSIS